MKKEEKPIQKVKEEVVEPVEDSEPPTMVVKPVTNDGKLVIKFSQAMRYPAVWKVED